MMNFCVKSFRLGIFRLRIFLLQVHEINFHKEGDRLQFYGQKLEFYNLQKVWTQLIEESDFRQRKVAVDEFNRLNHLIAICDVEK